MSVDKEKISELIKQYIQYSEQITKLEQEQHFIREIVRNHLKETNLDRASMDGNIVILSKYTKTSIDQTKLKQIITEEQYNNVLKKVEIESLKIMSDRSYKNMLENLKRR